MFCTRQGEIWVHALSDLPGVSVKKRPQNFVPLMIQLALTYCGSPLKLNVRMSPGRPVKTKTSSSRRHGLRGWSTGLSRLTFLKNQTYRESGDKNLKRRIMMVRNVEEGFASQELHLNTQCFFPQPCNLIQRQQSSCHKRKKIQASEFNLNVNFSNQIKMVQTWTFLFFMDVPRIQQPWGETELWFFFSFSAGLHN